MKLLTFNCYGVPLVSPSPQSRIQRIARRIRELKPDLVFLQEVFLTSHKEVLQDALYEFPYRYLPDDGALGMGGGLCCFSHIPLSKERFHPFSESGHWLDTSLSDKIAEKGFMTADANGFRFFHVHLTSNYNGNYSAEDKYLSIQRKQLKKLAEHVKTSPLKKPTFILGDFNIPPGATLFEKFLASTGAVDLTKSKEPSWEKAASSLKSIFKRRGDNNGKIDYILFRGRYAPPANWKYVFTESPRLSDHLGILMDVDIK